MKISREESRFQILALIEKKPSISDRSDVKEEEKEKKLQCESTRFLVSCLTPVEMKTLLTEVNRSVIDN